MKIYRTAPFEGYKLKEDCKGNMIVGIPERHLKTALKTGIPLEVRNKYFKNSTDHMTFKGDEEPIHINQFMDKFGRGEMYNLYYYEWEPIKELKLFEC